MTQFDKNEYGSYFKSCTIVASFNIEILSLTDTDLYYNIETDFVVHEVKNKETVGNILIMKFMRNLEYKHLNIAYA